MLQISNWDYLYVFWKLIVQFPKKILKKKMPSILIDFFTMEWWHFPFDFFTWNSVNYLHNWTDVEFHATNPPRRTKYWYYHSRKEDKHSCNSVWQSPPFYPPMIHNFPKKDNVLGGGLLHFLMFWKLGFTHTQGKSISQYGKKLHSS